MDAEGGPQLLQRVERTRRVVSHCSQAAIRAYDEEALLAEACRHLIDGGHYCLAWFAEAKPGEAKLATLAHASAELSGVRGQQLPWTVEMGPRAPSRRALAEQRPHVVRGIPDDPVLRKRNPDAEALGYGAICAFPLQFGPHGAGVLTIYAREPDAFAPEEVALLRELAGDMAVAVSALRARKANEALEERLEFAGRRFRGIVENAPVGVFQIGLEGQLVLANKALATMLGYESPDELVALGAEALPKHFEERDLERLRQAMAIDRPKPLQLALRRIDGGQTWVEVQAKPANLESEGVIEAFVRDLTLERSAAAIRTAQERQQQEVVRLRELAHMRSEFMGRASHELNTPLTPILLQVQALQAPGLDARQARGLALIERNVLRLAGLVKDLLAASTLEAGHVDLKPTSLDVTSLASEVAESFREQAQAAGIDLRIDTPDPVTAYADRACLTQVLFNLVSNAIKFTPRGGTVTVHCEPKEDSAFCRVTDTGRGLPPENLDKLFQAFGRLHEHVPGDPGGTGLGLFISKAIVEQSGGTLWASSPGPGQGTTFAFTLPARPKASPGRGIRTATGFQPGEVAAQADTPSLPPSAAELPAEQAPVQESGRTRNR